MCGRFVLAQVGILPDRFGFVDFHDTRLPPPRFNIAPSQEVLAIASGPEGPRARLLRWGFQPAWMREPKLPPPINARAETLLERKLFRDALGRGRCLIPADGFYEWAAVPGQRAKRPMHIRLKGGSPFAFAGLWTVGPDGVETCTIVTTAANELLSSIHERMPVILAPEDEVVWLDPATEVPAALGCLRAFLPEGMESYPVGGLVSSVGNEGPELIRAEMEAEVQPGLPLE